jgi:hypothetical protein
MDIKYRAGKKVIGRVNVINKSVLTHPPGTGNSPKKVLT